MRDRTAHRAGFTLTEMLIVIALIALIGTFVTQNIMSKYQRAKVDSTKIQMKPSTQRNGICVFTRPDHIVAIQQKI